MLVAPRSGLSASLTSSAEMEYGESEQDEPLLGDVWLTVLRWGVVTQSEATSRLDLLSPAQHIPYVRRNSDISLQKPFQATSCCRYTTAPFDYN